MTGAADWIGSLGRKACLSMLLCGCEGVFWCVAKWFLGYSWSTSLSALVLVMLDLVNASNKQYFWRTEYLIKIQETLFYYLLDTEIHSFSDSVSSVCGATDWYPWVDSGSGWSWNSVPGLPHLCHESAFPWNRGPSGVEGDGGTSPTDVLTDLTQANVSPEVN